MTRRQRIVLREVLSWATFFGMVAAAYAVVNEIQPNITMPAMIILALGCIVCSASEI